MTAKPWDDLPMIKQELDYERRAYVSRERGAMEGRVVDEEEFARSMRRHRERIAALEQQHKDCIAAIAATEEEDV